VDVEEEHLIRNALGPGAGVLEGLGPEQLRGALDAALDVAAEWRERAYSPGGVRWRPLSQHRRAVAGQVGRRVAAAGRAARGGQGGGDGR
jgi:hypothetical protein